MHRLQGPLCDMGAVPEAALLRERSYACSRLWLTPPLICLAARSRLAAESGFARMSTQRPASAAGERPPPGLAPLNMANIPPLQVNIPVNVCCGSNVTTLHTPRATS